MRQICVCAAIWTAAAGVLWAAPPAGPAPPASQLEAWLDQLDDESFARREEAIERLHAAGEASIEVLAQGSLSASPEVAWRAGEALKRIAITGNDRTLDRVAIALERVGKQGRGGMNKVVQEIRARQKQIRHDRAAAQIRQLGGGLAGGSDGSFAGGVFFGEIDAGIMTVVDVDVAAVEAAPAEAVEAAARVEEPAEETAADALPDAQALDLREAVEELFPAEEHAEKPAAGALIAPAAEAVEAVEADVHDIDIVVDEVALAGPGGLIVLGGGDIAAVDVEGARLAESLSLDSNWRGGDKGLAVLRDLPDVTMINIQGAKLTDAGLAHLATLPKLRNITIQGTKFSAAALRKLHRAKPGAYLYCQGEGMMGIHAETTGDCVLTGVYPGSGSADAGLQVGDKVVAIDDLDVRDFSELTIAVYTRTIGDKLKVEFERDGKRQTTHVELRARKVLEP